MLLHLYEYHDLDVNLYQFSYYNTTHKKILIFIYKFYIIFNLQLLYNVLD